MRLLDRYLLRELLVPLGYCLCGFFLFWISFDLFNELDDLQKVGLTALEIAAYYALSSPQFLSLVLPMGLLLALLYSLTRHARYNELTAIRAAGVSLWRVTLPYFAVGIFASLLLFTLNELWAPACGEAAERLLHKAVDPGQSAEAQGVVRNLGFVNARDGRRWQIGSYNLDTEEMTQPQVHWYQKDGTMCSVYAEKGVRTNDTWLFLNVWVYADVGQTNRHLQPSLQTNAWELTMLTETPDQIRSEVQISKRLSSIVDTKEADIPLTVILDYLRLHPSPEPAVASWLRTMLHGRMAHPWTCAVVVLIAVPFAAGAGRRNLFVGVASSILICFAYFVLQQVSMAMGSGGYLPPWLAAWFPNAAFAIGGLWMMTRIR